VAAGAGLLGNTRYLPMGFAIAPDVTGSSCRRAANAAALADASFLMARRVDGGFDPRALVWAAPVQYVCWVGGTVGGATTAGPLLTPPGGGWTCSSPCSTPNCTFAAKIDKPPRHAEVLSK
jgi:predicted branched-subunit amino acid permease